VSAVVELLRRMKSEWAIPSGADARTP
jgi:hypothetical protein